MRMLTTWAWIVLTLALASGAAAAKEPAIRTQAAFHDLSLLVAPELPCYWTAGFPPFDINHYLRIGPLSAYNSDILTIDEHTGTQFDAPAHFVPPPDSGLPDASPLGLVTGEKVPAWQFCGEACVIDCSDMLESGPAGISPLITRDRVRAWEKSHRPLKAGDVVLFRSGYTDKFYAPFPQGRRLIADPVQGTAPGWPDPDAACMDYLASRGVMTLGTDSPSMGPIPGDLAPRVHVAGLKHGMIWTECGTRYGQLPATGAFYCMVGVKHAGSSGSEGRAFAIEPGSLAERLNAASRQHQVVDLSVTLSEDFPVSWPGAGTGNHRCPYYNKVINNFGKGGPYLAQTHRMDSHSGTHLVPPAYALPAEGFDSSNYAPEVQEWLAEYEKKFGPRGLSDVTTEKVPLEQTCGEARVIDVSSLVGSTDNSAWPASPEITAEQIEAWESQHGPLQAGDVVLFRSGYSDRHYLPMPEGNSCLKLPLDGQAEGWPAPGAAAIQLLAKRGIRCVGTDGPTLGGVDPRRALFTYWQLASQGMVGVEYLTNLDQVPDKAYFIFAAVKIRGCHGGPGRAIALY
ncbi:MAG: cyclase family protein [Pirellulales bacterium]